ncbi:uncharacterized protein M421DRAFT_73470 [Didymella exigua CBS 183.55]|uniref:YMC020W-like alpha/beta hydrolase domain-containing protein n=1 Tax=Didymella exigua CBS 183.55 TaxID=1150837 RepID=A0A6A5R7B8_9PLEO|nr:uncharacterized protein M421DRAFT_73470 [Didymella exigua CBS 183.55]KAF1924071.1 hypothetical protein M421DRAFT_73470 [Didymella exigua CBS 183.55]
MSPRKKAKPNPEAPTDGKAEASTTEASAKTKGTSTPATTGTQTPKSARKWLGGTGSWRSKAPAVVKTAQETIGISVSGGATSELPKEAAKQPSSDSPARFLTKRKSSKSFALPTSTTKITVSSDGSVEEAEVAAAKKDDDTPAPETAPSGDEAPLPPEPAQTEQVANTWGWTSWWSRPDGYTDAAKAKTASVEEASSTPLPGPTPSEEPDAVAKGLDGALANDKITDGDKKVDVLAESAPVDAMETKDASATAGKATLRNTASGSWFWLWSTQQNVQANSPEPQQAAKDFFTPNTYSDQTTELAPTDVAGPPQEAPQEALPTESTEPTEPAKPADALAEAPQEPPKTQPKASGWAFWYREPTDSKPAEGEAQKHVGEVAVFDTPSQSHPEAAQFNEQEQSKSDTLEAVKESPKPKESIVKKSLGSLRGRARKKATLKDVSSETPADTPASSAPATPTRSSPERGPTRTTQAAPTAQPAPKQADKAKQEPPNLILPEFNSTYRLARQPTFWKQVRQYFLGAEPLAPHLHINPAPPRIKKAVAIGVHGFFPAPIFQRIMGQPTGTSIRFANAAAAAIKEWSEARGYCPEIEQVALEGEGFIAERVNTLWKLLLNWIDHIKSADFVLVACHSQGVPVAMMLVAKLIQFGCIGKDVRVGVCAMAGVNMGPFIEYKTKYFGPTAAELFEFSNPQSLVSQMYLAALDEVLRFGVRIMYVGSIDDQLVSLESSTFSTLSHPYIYRAVFVDGRIHAPDFLTHLVGFTLKLRNLGLPDHGLIRELSPALAGSLYGGEGHSRVYEDARVYSLAVSHALETTSLPVQGRERPSSSGSFAGINIPVVGEAMAKGALGKEDVLKLKVKDYATPATAASQNPYFLPWAMRGLLEEDFVKKELGEEVEELLAMFEEWRPVAKQLKEVKFRLEAVRSKL